MSFCHRIEDTLRHSVSVLRIHYVILWQCWGYITSFCDSVEDKLRHFEYWYSWNFINKCWGTCAARWKVFGSILDVFTEIVVDIIPAALFPGVDTASNRNKHQGYFLWGRGGRYVWLTPLPLSRNCGNLNLLHPPGTVQSCIWVAVRLPYN